MKKKTIYLASVALSVVLLILGYMYVVRNGSPFGVIPEGQGGYFRATVLSVEEPIIEESEYSTTETYNFTVKIKRGPYKGTEQTASQIISSDAPVNSRPVSKGDSIILYESVVDDESTFAFAEYVRSDALIVLAVLFAVFLVAFGRMKGFKTLITLILTVAAVFFVMFPAILNGENVYVFTIIVCTYVAAMTYLIVNGISYLSLVSFLGCVGGVLISAAMTLITNGFIKLTGYRDDSDIFLMYINIDNGGIDIKALVFAGILIGSIGAVMDVAINMSAALHEVACKIEKPTFKELYKSGITISRDMIGTMCNTLILAYTGGSLSTVLLVVYNNSFSPLAMFNKESMICELLTMLIGSFGILSALPLTSAIAALCFSKWDKSVVYSPQDNEAVKNSEIDEFSAILDKAND